MSVQITEQEITEALAEIAEMGRQKVVDKSWSDELFRFVTDAMGDMRSREPGKLSYAELARYLYNKGWYRKCSAQALAQAFRAERSRRLAKESNHKGEE